MRSATLLAVLALSLSGQYESDYRRLMTHPLAMPVQGIPPGDIQDTFSDARSGGRAHQATDIPAPRGTPVLAMDDGVVRKLFTSVKGGLTIYEFDSTESYCYYYAHLDRYAGGLKENQPLRHGEVIGFVGATGDAAQEAPHLHLEITRIGADKKWWGGVPIDPYPLLMRIDR
jgi:murein DD-endopeptidase MepM/ murein hydrolase activator NlpD